MIKCFCDICGCEVVYDKSIVNKRSRYAIYLTDRNERDNSVEKELCINCYAGLKYLIEKYIGDKQ